MISLNNNNGGGPAGAHSKDPAPHRSRNREHRGGFSRSTEWREGKKGWFTVATRFDAKLSRRGGGHRSRLLDRALLRPG